MNAMGNFLQTAHALELRFGESKEELTKKLLLEAISRLCQSLSQGPDLGWTQAYRRWTAWPLHIALTVQMNMSTYLPPVMEINA